MLRWSIVGFALGLLVALMPSCGPTTTLCLASNCNGCCDSSGKCQTGTAASACGISASACQQCLNGQVCQSGVCAAGTQDGGACSAANCSGCCDSTGTCRKPGVGSTANSACGANGAACAVCTAQQSCNALGACQNTNPTCTPTNCAGGCCNGNTCVLYATETNTLCGASGNACTSCATTCNTTNGTCPAASCNSTNCPSGCCNGTTCVPFATETDIQCGNSGGACTSCTTTGGTCNKTTGTCQGGSCSGTNCASGCCNGTTCVVYANEVNTECGTAGAACSDCTTSSQVCNMTNGTCQAPPTCNSGNCAAGCCNGTTCVPFLSESNTQCGTGGNACANCTTSGQTCNTTSWTCQGTTTVGVTHVSSGSPMPPIWVQTSAAPFTPADTGAASAYVGQLVQLNASVTTSNGLGSDPGCPLPFVGKTGTHYCDGFDVTGPAVVDLFGYLGSTCAYAGDGTPYSMITGIWEDNYNTQNHLDTWVIALATCGGAGGGGPDAGNTTTPPQSTDIHTLLTTGVTDGANVSAHGVVIGSWNSATSAAFGFAMEDPAGGPQAGIHVRNRADSGIPVTQKPNIGDYVSVNGTGRIISTDGGPTYPEIEF